MNDELVREVGSVRLVARSLTLSGQPDGESDYIVSAGEIHGHLHSPPIRVTKPAGAKAALDIAANDPWVLDHKGSASFRP